MPRCSFSRLVVMFTWIVAFGGVSSVPALGQGTAGPYGFEEQFAFAVDREAVLDQLVPGSREDYYYRCLLHQHAGEFDQVERLLKSWIQSHGRDSRVQRIQARQALLTFDGDPAATYDFLRRELGLSFNHRREVPGQMPDLPTRLDPTLISRETLTRRALANSKTLRGFNDSALPFLLASDLDGDRLRGVLERLERPDHPNLPALIVRDLDHRQSRGFGSIPIHRKLLAAQLEECLRLRPSLLDDRVFVETLLQRLQPDADVDWQRNGAARQAYLDRLESFTRRLPPVHDSLTAHVLHHRLLFDRSRGVHDKERFMTYLRLPRPSQHVLPGYRQQRSRTTGVVDLSVRFPTGLDPVLNDEDLVRDYLTHFFRQEESWQPYAEFVRDDYLRRVFAETKILYGLGEDSDAAERWYAMLDDPAYYERLKDRVEIDFAPTQQRFFGADEEVVLDLDVKHVDTLLVKVFEINTFNFHAEREQDVDASIELDGLVASEETVHTYDESPLRRVRRSFSFPALSQPGTYVVELIGNGMSSRAVIRKGALQVVERVGAAGHVCRVLDEAGQHLRDASIWMAGRQYEPDEQGEIAIPFSTEPGTRKLVLRHGELSALAEFQHQAETYELFAGISIDRESLIADATATILVRPTLQVNGRAASLALLEDVVLTITSRDRDGVSSTLEVRDPELGPGGELLHTIDVPPGLASLTVDLAGRVANLSTGQDERLHAPRRVFPVNVIDTTERTWTALLGRTEDGYVLDVLGKNGEPKPHRALGLELDHRDFSDPVQVQLMTDARGRVDLGRLRDITAVYTKALPSEVDQWDLVTYARTYPHRLHGVAGEVLRVPYQGAATRVSRDVASLLELRGGQFALDRFGHLALADGFLELRELPPGDYDLWLPEAERSIEVRVGVGQRDGRWILGDARRLPVDQPPPLHVTDVGVTGDALEIRLANAGARTRVHVVATRFVAAFDPFAMLATPADRGRPVESMLHPASSYHAGREIGDEYRYILDRRYAAKFPGNMLRRPGLLLNPWAVDESDTAIGVGGGAGGSFGKVGRRAGSPLRRADDRSSGIAPGPGLFANLDFLAEPSRQLANLEPDADGLVRIPLADLGAGHELHIVAVDGVSTVYATHVLPEPELQRRDRRLLLGLDPSRHYAEQRRIEFVDTDASTVVEDVATSEVELYDSLAAVHRLFSTLSGDADLARFEFVLRWPELERDERLALYAEYACHELHLFLHQKDRAFFDEVVRPYLANKMDKTFLDHWLLEDDLSAYLEPWAFGRLNVVERILLGRRLDGQAAGVARQLGELVDLVPPDPERERSLFRTALMGQALDTGPSLGKKVKAAGESRRDEMLDQLGYLGESVEEAAPPAARVAGALAVQADELVYETENDSDFARRANQRALYRAPERTREYAEHNYWHLRIRQQGPELVRPNAFWLDYARAPNGVPFVSSHVGAAAGSFAEMMLALAVLDLPFEAGVHETAIEDGRLELRAAGPLLLVRRELTEAAPAEDEAAVLLGQNLFRLDDRYRFEGNQRFDKYVSDEFLVDVPYGCQVVVTNPTSSPRDLELLLQIPRGAMPVLGGFTTRGVDVRLDAFSTTTFEYHFYFPGPGDYAHYPAHVSRDGRSVAFTEPATLSVVREPTKVDTTSWAHVSQNGTLDEVLAYLDGENIRRVDLERIAWRMGERGAFERVLDHLRERHMPSMTLWSYGLRHGDVRATQEYLQHRDDLVARCGPVLQSPLLSLDPVQRRTYEHLEYEPLFNGRAHRFSAQRGLLNAGLLRQYVSFLDVLVHRPSLRAADWMEVTYYLLLQDRIAEALAAFARVQPEELSMQLQYDYARAYLDFFSEERALARPIAEAHADHPVPRWQARFRDVIAHLDEAQGGAVAGAGDDDLAAQQTALAASEPSLELDVEARRITLRHDNLDEVRLSFYAMDVEFLFSTSPFVQQGAGSFAYVKPNRSDVIALDADAGSTTIDLPAEFGSANVLVEARAAGVVRRQASYANSLVVAVFENYGQLKVTDTETGAPLARSYVKVFARTSGGSTRFHKDGYTDLRGRFDYASLSGSGATDVERFAVLVLSETHGAVIRELAPPTR